MNKHTIQRERDQPTELITIRDLKADLHCHSIEGSPRDAIYTVDQLARFYQEVLGVEYMILTNHCWREDPSFLEKTGQAVLTTRNKYPDFDILNGLELNIDEEGIIRVNPDVYSSEFNIASIHQRPFSPTVDVTSRLLTALENPLVDVIGHPGIYLPNYEEAIDWEALAQKAKELGKAIELNLYELQECFDNDDFQNSSIYIFRDKIMRVLANSGVQISLGSDMHKHTRVANLEPLQFKWRKLFNVIYYLQELGFRKSQVVNSMSANDLRSWTQSHRNFTEI